MIYQKSNPQWCADLTGCVEGVVQAFCDQFHINQGGCYGQMLNPVSLAGERGFLLSIGGNRVIRWLHACVGHH